MSILATFCMSLLVHSFDRSLVPTSNPSAWIAVLRDYESRLGRDAWSYQELCNARSSVLDPYYSVPPASGWMKSLFSIYLNIYPLVFCLIVILCGCLAGYHAWRNNWGTVLFVCLMWFFLMWMLLLPVQPQSTPIAVVKLQGTQMREGNGVSYPVVMRDKALLKLAAGVEARLLAERSNGWVQLQLPDGTVGWTPADSVYLVR